MRHKTILFALLMTLAPAMSMAADPGKVRMPMRFTPDGDSEALLETYPLGQLNRLAILSHHGKADSKTRLPNGLTGWVYDKGVHRVPKAYVLPDGTEQVVKEREESGPTNMYILVFDSNGVVIDVIHQYRSSVKTALQVQMKNQSD